MNSVRDASQLGRLSTLALGPLLRFSHDPAMRGVGLTAPLPL